MPPARVQLVPIVVTFDALETLIQVTGGAGYQYLSAAREFLRRSRNGSPSPPDPSPAPQKMETFNATAVAIIRDSMKTARAQWSRLHPGEDPKTMPIGGMDDQELWAFWRHVLGRVFTETDLPGLSQADQTYLRSLATKSMGEPQKADGDAVPDDTTAMTQTTTEWDAFLHAIVFGRFASAEGHSWLPAGERTLRCLREWNAHQWARANKAAADGAEVTLWAPPTPTTAEPAGTPLLVLARPPAIVSNMDPRLRSVMNELGALGENAVVPSSSALWETYVRHPESLQKWPLVSEIITGRDAGRAKPSAVGLDLAAQHAGVDSRHVPAALKQVLHVHVGDAEADRLACEAQECAYLRCDGHVGVEWESLHDVLRHAEQAAKAYFGAPLIH